MTRRELWEMIGRGKVGEGVGKPVNSILNTCFAIYCSVLGDLCTKNIIKTHCLRRLGPSMLGHRQKKNRKKSRYLRLPPNLAHRKLIALANYVPRSSPLRVLSFTQRFFKNVEKMAMRSEKYLGCFA